MKENRFRLALGIAATLIFAYLPAHARDASSCDATLAKDTFQSYSTSSVDYRLALLVKKDQWDEASHKAGVNAVIYGVPVGASYEDYRKNVQQALMSRNESFSDQEVRAVGVESLSDNGKAAYIACLKALGNGFGLSVSVGQMTETEAILYVAYSPSQISHPHPINVTIKGAQFLDGGKAVRKIIPNQEIDVKIARPKTASSLVIVSSPNLSADNTEVLPPVKKVAPPPKYSLYVTEIDDKFVCTLNAQKDPVIEVGFGTSNTFQLSPWMIPGRNILACQIIDIHPDSNFNPCWHYHYRVDGPTPPIEHSLGSCGSGSQPPVAITPEVLYN